MLDLRGFRPAEVQAVLMVGSGAVVNAWAPVLEALEDRIPAADAELANLYMATLVQRLRWLHGIVRKTEGKFRARYQALLRDCLAEYRDTTASIGSALRAQAGMLHVRPEGPLIVKRLLDTPAQDAPFAIITTNWDFSIAALQDRGTRESAGINYLHGTYEVGMYLPGEVLDEPYRSEDNRSEFGSAMFETVHIVRDAQRLVVYGLSFSPLDAELGFLLYSAAQQRQRPFDEVVVVDLKPDAVISRLTVHLGPQKFIGTKPEDVASLTLNGLYW